MRPFLLFSFFLALCSQYSCKKYAPAPEAFFIKPESVTVNATAMQGTKIHKITDLWLYVNGQFQGAYPVGNIMPVVTNNSKVKIHVKAGIKNNGISDTRIPWDFFQLIEFDTLVESGKTITRPFVFQYLASTTFTWNENFEATTASGYTLKRSQISEADYEIKSDNQGVEGKYLELVLPANKRIAQIESSIDKFALPKNTGNVYLELNYKCNQEFSMGLVTEKGELKPVFFLNAQNDWNKTYIQMATLINTEPVSDRYGVYFAMVKSESDPEAKLCLDNIKLVYLQ